jgi:hypothetical protein
MLLELNVESPYRFVPLKRSVFTALLIASAPVTGAGAQPQISQDRELKELDLTRWDCLNRPEGSARTPSGVERNRLKNRSAPTSPVASSEALDTPAFLEKLAEFDARTNGKKRGELSSPQKQQLDAFEKQVVHFTGYLVAAYCGPPETTNCRSTDFHDWHLELFEKPQDHPPQPGDPTPVVCEITPRTQNAIFRDGIRIQELTAFVRPPDPHLAYESTGHAARRVRVTGYLLWDDEHNGSADVGTTIRKIAASGYHQPWRSTAWEIHPVLKIQAADTAATGKLEPARPSSQPVANPSVENISPTPAQRAPAPASETTPVSTSALSTTPVRPVPAEQPPTLKTPEFVIVTQPVKVKIPYGETVLPRGAKLPVLSRDAQTVRVQYLGETYAIPVTSTDLR